MFVYTISDIIQYGFLALILMLFLIAYLGGKYEQWKQKRKKEQTNIKGE